MKLSQNPRDIYREHLASLQPKTESQLPRSIDGSLKRKPLIEVIDLTIQDGVGFILPFEVLGDFDQALKEPFVRVARMIVLHTWAGTTVDFDNWCNGGGLGELPNGFQIEIGYDGSEIPLLPIPITSTKDYMRYAYDVDTVVDTAGASKKVYFTSRLSFHKFMGNNEGIDLSEGRVLRVTGPKNGDLQISEYGSELTYTFEGWGWDT